MHYDLIIIGMGLSGLMAAKTATEMGKKILIIGKGMGSLSLFSHTIDLFGAVPKEMRMNEGLSQWMKDHPEHPYSKVGSERIGEALSSFISLFPPPASFEAAGDGNSFIPTAAGTFRPTYLIPVTMVAGASLKEGDALIVGFKGFKDFYAHYVANQLNCQGITLPLPEPFNREIAATALARLMEKKSFRETIGKEIKKQLHGQTRVGFPAILGIQNSFEIKKGLEEIINAEVFEIPTLPPSIPGMRIFNRFKEWLIERGATFLLGHSISRALLKDKRCEGVDVLNPPIFNSYFADRYILATGRFIGGGLVADEEKIFESIFDLPVSQPKEREAWFQKSFFSNLSHPVHEAGILTDSSLRPVDENGNLVLENVWVAGSILAHHHCIDEKSREGIEIATGYMAAQKALEG